MSNGRKNQGFLAHYFIEKDKDRGLSYVYGLRKEGELPLYLLKTAPIVRFDSNADRFFTHYGMYSTGELITDPAEIQFYKRILAGSEIHFLDDFVASLPLSTTLH